MPVQSNDETLDRDNTPPKRDLRGKSFSFYGQFSYWPSYHVGQPADAARRLGALITETVDENLDYLVLGDGRGKGRAEAKKRAEKLRLRAEQFRLQGKTLSYPETLDEGTFREMVRADLTDKTFCFFGGFDCCGGDRDEQLLTSMVQTAGGSVSVEVDDKLDYLVLGNRRGESKIAAQNKAKKLQAGGAKVQIVNEGGFLELVRADHPCGVAEEGDSTPDVADFATFITRLHGTVDQGKLGRAMKMLKGESFQLYVQQDDERLVGVIRSQTGTGNVYASWLTAKGNYGCSTAELDACMGLSGQVCKHLLVLLLGLTRTGQMLPEAAYAWVRAARTKSPSSDNDLAAETFLQYRGAQAGEIDWRPTETIPEDFYAFS